MRAWMLVVLAGCSLATATELPTCGDADAMPDPGPYQPPPWEVPVVADPPGFNVFRVAADTAYAGSTLRELATYLQGLPEPVREHLARQSDFLATNCAFTRATYMVPLVVERELATIDARGLTPLTQRRLTTLTEAVGAHADVLRALGASRLPMPTNKDLVGRFNLDLSDGKAFASSEDAMHETTELIASVLDVTRAIDDAHGHKLEAARKAQEVYVGDRHVIDAAFRRWLAELDALEDEVDDAAVREVLTKTHALVDALMWQSC